jgi:RNA polymerase sigma factor (sigma-70 family)
VTDHAVGDSLSSLSDAELIEFCLQGDSASWEALIRKYQNLIYSVPLKHRLSAQDAADIFQSVCVVMMQKLNTLRQSQTLASWLYVTTRRQCWKLLRKQSREVEIDENVEDVVEDSAEDVVLQHQIRMGLAQLSDKCRELLTALYYDDPPLSYDDITKKFGVPYGSIGPNRARCLERLKKILGRKG